MTNCCTVCVTGTITVMLVDENPDHSGPVNFSEVAAGGAFSGLPQKHLATGAPCTSTSTAVPACSTAGISVARPSLKPWLVTLVSDRSSAGVRLATKVGIWST